MHWLVSMTFRLPDRFLIAARTAVPFQHLPLGALEPAVAHSFAFYQSHTQHEYAYHYREPALIEPATGFILRPGLRPIAESMPHSWECGVPRWPRLLRSRLRSAVLHVPRVISLREFGDANYYHFYNDVLGKLALLDGLGIGAGWPVLISARLAAQPYFASLLRCSALGERSWIVQQSDFVRSDEVLFCKPMPHQRRNFDYTLDQMMLPALQGERRVLLVRRRTRGRWLENGDDVTGTCRSFGFETVDADELSFEAQIALFRTTRFLVGIHGAGLVNCMFRRGGQLDILELFPPDNIPPHYFWLAQNYGFGYDAMVGTAGAKSNAFRIDTQALHAKLSAMANVPA